MSHKCELYEQSAQPALVIHTHCAVENLPQVLGESYSAIIKHLTDLQEEPGGAPFVTYFDMNMQNLDVEIGFPTIKLLVGNDAITSKEMPAGKYASVLHKGPYPELGSAYEALNQFLNENGLQPTGVVYEFYLNSPMEVPSEELKTQIVFPIASN